VNFFETSSPDQYAGLGAGSAARRRMLAYQMLQKEAGSTDGGVYSHGHGVMKLGAGMLGAALEGWEEKKLAKERQELAKASTCWRSRLPNGGRRSRRTTRPAA
jgi:hypothetical protein